MIMLGDFCVVDEYTFYSVPNQFFIIFYITLFI